MTNDIERYNFWHSEMDQYVKNSQKKINVEAINDIGKKFAKINEYIQNGEEVPAELSKNFISFPLSDDALDSLDDL